MSRSTNTIMLSLLLGSAAFVGSMIPAKADNPPGASQCTAADVNNSGTAIINCLVGDVRYPYVELNGVQSRLAPATFTPGGTPCAAKKINNGVGGAALIIGTCKDNAQQTQSVVWTAGSPGTAPVYLKSRKINTVANAINLQGIIVGADIDREGVKYTATWTPDGTLTLLPNITQPSPNNVNDCEPVDISDDATPVIVGNCARVSNSSRPIATAWVGVGGSGTSLVGPKNFCTVTKVGLSGRMIGSCFNSANEPQYGDGVYWPSVAASGLIANGLNTVNDKIALTDINDNGRIACYDTNIGATVVACEWDGMNLGNGANLIPDPTRLYDTRAVAIGNNGRIVGNTETPPGSAGVPVFLQPFHYNFGGGGSVVLDGPGSGGPNTRVKALSPDGRFQVLEAESSTQAKTYIKR
jgi:hypothetical protein